MRAILIRFLRDENGGPAIEFALMGSLIAVCVPVMIDMAALLNAHINLSAGIRAGEQYALKYSTDEAGITQAINGASGLSSESTTVTTSEFCECEGVSHVCSDHCDYGVTLEKYLTINADYTIADQYNFNIDTYPQTLSRSITVRTQ